MSEENKPKDSNYQEIRNWFKLLNNDIDKKRQAKQLVEDQFWDDNNGHELPHHIDFSKRDLQAIRNEKHRAVFVLFTSNCFSRESIGRLLGIDRKTVDKYHEIAKQILQN